MRPRGLHDVLRNTDAFGPGCTASALMAVQEHRIFSFLAQAAVQPDTYLRSGCSVTPSCDAPDHSDRAGRVDIPYRRAASISTTHLQYLVNATSEESETQRNRETDGKSRVQRTDVGISSRISFETCSWNRMCCHRFIACMHTETKIDRKHVLRT